MEIIHGKGIVDNIAFGEIHVIKNHSIKATAKKISDTRQEIDRFNAAREETVRQLHAIHQKALAKVGKEEAEIFEVYQMMLKDADFIKEVSSMISEKETSAEYAVSSVGERFAGIFSCMEDEIMKERSFDIRGVVNYILGILQGEDPSTATKLKKPAIIVADDLTPDQIVQFDRNSVLAFVTKIGSPTSHLAVLARTMNIAAVVSVGDQADFLSEGKYAIINGYTGEVFIDPDQETISDLKRKKLLYEEQKKSLDALKGKESVTLDGHHIEISANVCDPSDIYLALSNDAESIGLFRSEFIYLNRKSLPTEDQQFAIYSNILKKMSPKRVVIRTLDVGSDKKLSYLDMSKDRNPALGERAIRFSFKHMKIFKTQIRALLRASIYGRLAIMFPLIISKAEVQRAKSIIDDIKLELDSKNIKYSKDIEIGIMVETPAAVLISDILSKEVDFFSIGTNDLIQYTEAIDRQNPNLEDFFDPYHLAVLRSIQMVVDNAHKDNIWVGICGELGSDERLTEFFLSIGVDELSISPSKILKLRKFVRDCDVSKIKDKCLKDLG